jgi:C4-dicarboxylate-specific signal transduction histidine kinase
LESPINLDYVAQLEQRLVDLQYAEKLQQALFKISSLSHDEMDLQQLYHKVHLIIDDVLEAKNFFIALLDDENQTISLPYFIDEKDFDEKDMTGQTLDVGEGLSSYVIRTRTPQLITANIVKKLIKSGEIQEVLGSTEFTCWMGAPMISAETMHGIIVVQSYQKDALYNQNDLKLLDFVANQVANAIEMNVNESQRREAQLRLAEQHRTLEQKNITLTKTIKDLKKAQEELVQKEKMASLGGLVAGIAHEINTPLGICVTATSHLFEEHNEIKKAYESGELTEDSLNEYFDEFSQGLKILSSNTKRAAELVKSFKQVAVDQSSNEIRTINVSQYIQEIILSLKPKLKRVSHEIIIDCPDHINVEINAGAVSQIFSNFIMNSIIHGFEGIENGRIHIKVTVKANQLKIHYVDNGKGIEAHSLAQLFEPFFTTKRGEGGSGLGTHLIYNLVHSSLNGSIKAQSEPNKGLAYLIKVPL